MLIQMAISRSREYLADEAGARIAGNPRSLASALRKVDAASQRIPLQANPATAHMFIVSPLRGPRLYEPVQHASAYGKTCVTAGEHGW